MEHQYDRWQPARTVAGEVRRRASKLLPLLDKGHYDVSLSPDELRRMIVWLDANSDFFGAYHQTEAQSRGAVVEPSLQWRPPEEGQTLPLSSNLPKGGKYHFVLVMGLSPDSGRFAVHSTARR